MGANLGKCQFNRSATASSSPTPPRCFGRPLPSHRSSLSPSHIIFSMPKLTDRVASAAQALRAVPRRVVGEYSRACRACASAPLRVLALAHTRAYPFLCSRLPDAIRQKGRGPRPSSILTSGDSAEREDRPSAYQPVGRGSGRSALARRLTSLRARFGSEPPAYASEAANATPQRQRPLRAVNGSYSEDSDVRAASYRATRASEEECPDVEAASCTATLWVEGEN